LELGPITELVRFGVRTYSRTRKLFNDRGKFTPEKTQLNVPEAISQLLPYRSPIQILRMMQSPGVNYMGGYLTCLLYVG
jgi:hypothetical protein